MNIKFTTEELKADFKNFLCLVWFYVGLPEPTQIQLDIADYLQHAPRRRVIEAFRGVGKSWITAAYVVWRLFCNPQKKILVVSGSKSLADNFSTFCLQIINLVPEVEHLIPRDDQREAKVQFDVGPALASKDPSVRAVGITGMITGSRADEVIADDIESANNSQTQMMRDKLSESVKEFDAVLKPDGIVTFLGTPQCEQSIYNLLPTRGYDLRIWPARYPDLAVTRSSDNRLSPVILELVKNNPQLIGASTDPKRFSDLDLMEREASYGRSGFALQFQLDTSLSDSNRYPLKLSDLIVMSISSDLAPPKVAWASSPELAWNTLHNVGFNGDRYYRPMYIAKDDWAPYTGSVMAIDPGGRGRDETGICVIKMLHSMLFCPVLTGLSGGPTVENLERIARLAKMNGVNLIRVEPNFGDGMFAQLLRPVVQRIHPGCSVEDDKRSSGQKEKRIIDTLEPVLNQHRLIVDPKVIEDDAKSNQGMSLEQAQRYQGFYQLSRITRDRGSLLHDDRLDALAMAVSHFTSMLSLSVDEAAMDHKGRLLQREIDTFLEESCDVKKREPKWFYVGN